ncbi:MAG: hypothetical protein JXB47_17970 [Anaerolineae bacterium]|nr:hypothetical protein [Anaerolineae bacterium]
MKSWVCLIGLLLLAACTPTPTPTSAPTDTPPPTAVPPTEGPPPTETPIPSVTPGAGILKTDGVFAYQAALGGQGRYTLDVEAGQAIRVEVTTEDAALDLRLVIAGPNEYQFAAVDRGGPGEPEAVPEFQFPLDGLYSLRVEAAAGSGLARGELKFLSETGRTGGGHFAPFTADADGNLTGPAPIDAEMHAPDTFHAYSFDVAENQIVRLYALAADPEALNLYFHLFRSDGERVGLFDDEQPPTTPLLRDRDLIYPGTYYVLVGARSGAGAYRMILEPGG